MASKTSLLYLSPAVDIILSEGADVAEPTRRVEDIDLVLPFMEKQVRMVDNQISSLGRGATGFNARMRIINLVAELRTAKNYPSIPYRLWDNMAISTWPFTFQVYSAESRAFKNWTVPSSPTGLASDDILDEQEAMKKKIESLKELRDVLCPPAPEEEEQVGTEQDVLSPPALEKEEDSDEEQDSAMEDDESEFNGFSDDDMEVEASAPTPVAPLCRYELDLTQTKEGTTYDPATGIVTADNGDGNPITYQLEHNYNKSDLGVYGYNGKLRFVLKRVYH